MVTRFKAFLVHPWWFLEGILHINYKRIAVRLANPHEPSKGFIVFAKVCIKDKVFVTGVHVDKPGYLVSPSFVTLAHFFRDLEKLGLPAIAMSLKTRNDTIVHHRTERIDQYVKKLRKI